MQRRFILFLVLVWILLPMRSRPAGAAPPNIIINEVLANPASESTDEFVELYNAGDDAIDIAGWILADRGDNNDTIIDYTGPFDPGLPGTIVPPRGYALIVDPDYTGAYDAYLRLYADTALLMIVTISGDRTLGNGLGNSDDMIALDDGAGMVRRFAWTTSAGGDGVSWEKIVPGNGDVPSNWSPSRSPSGSTPGVRNSLAPAEYDAAVSPDDILIAPESPSVDETVDITVVIRNAGSFALASIDVTLFIDANTDSLPDITEEILRERLAAPLAPGDSAAVSGRWLPDGPGIHRIGVHAAAPDDERQINDIAIKEVRVAYPPQSLIISEIMYAPRPGDPEWIELYALSETRLDLTGWTIEDADSTTVRRIVSMPYIVEAKTYFIVTSDTSDFMATFPDVIAPVFRPSGGLPALNNTGDTITLRGPAGRVIDRVVYTDDWGGENYASLERRQQEGASQDSLNWGSSRAISLSTPGEENSLTPPPIDVGLQATDIRISPLHPGPADMVSVTAVIRNTGRHSVSGIRIDVLDYPVAGEQAESGRVINHGMIGHTIPPGDSVYTRIQDRFSSGIHRLIVRITHPDDGDSTNNRAAVTFPVRYARHTLIINEIMFDPGDEGGEWIEVFNTGAVPVDLAGWTVESGDSAKSRVITDTFFALPAQAYAVLASDTVEFRTRFGETAAIALRPRGGWTALRNDGARITVRDMTGTLIDRVDYIPEWSMESGRSAERIHPDRPSDEGASWGASASVLGGTPGERNSLFATHISARLSVEISPNPFSPNGDGRDDTAAIHLNLPVTSAVVRVVIYDVLGRRLKTLLDQQPTGSRRTVLWDGTDDLGRRAHIGQYILYLEMMQPETGVSDALKRVIVLADHL